MSLDANRNVGKTRNAVFKNLVQKPPEVSTAGESNTVLLRRIVILYQVSSVFTVVYNAAP